MPRDYLSKKLFIGIGLGILLLSVFLGLSENKQSSEKQTRQNLPIASLSENTKGTRPMLGNDFLVTRVIDGDTIEIEGGQRIRYIGIDTPETVDPRKPVQCFGIEASRRNKELVEDKRVRLEKDVSEVDKYGRFLRYVYAGNTFINLLLVQEGFAHSYTYPPDIKYQNLFTEAELLARKQKNGLWSSCPTATPPVITPAKTASSSCVIKGNISEAGKIYHLPGCSFYEKTRIDEIRGERWFCTEAEAVTAGWRKAKNCP